MEIKLIINPQARKANEHLADYLVDLLKKPGFRIETVICPEMGDARRAATQAVLEKKDLVVVAGGDGTINEVVNGLALSEITLGIIPLGTGNVFILELGISSNIAKAVEIILQGQTKKIDLGQIDHHYFLLWVGVGIDAKIIEEVHRWPTLKKILGVISFFLFGLKTLIFYRSRKLKIEADGKSYYGYFAVCSNIKLYAGGVTISPIALTDDGFLDLCLFQSKGIFASLKYILYLIRGAHYTLDDVELIRIKKAVISSQKRLLVHADGDLCSKTPVKIKVVPQALNIIVP